MKQSDFIKQSHIPAELIRAVVRQSRGWGQFQEIAADVTNHGASGGFGGWIYYTETNAFTKRNKKAILAYAAEQAKEFGQGLLETIAGFNVFKRDPVSVDEVARAIYQGRGDMAEQILNVLAWYALEEVARAYVDAIEG